MRDNDGRAAVPLGVLTACVAVSLVMLVLAPVPGGRHYEYAVLLALALTAVWLLRAAPPAAFFGKGVAVFVLSCGLGLGAANLAVISSGSEIVRTYGSVFDALETGRNPYTAGTIYHEIEGAGPAYGNFNYPPLEIVPYYLAYRAAGAWNMTVLALTMILLQAVAALVLFRALPGVRTALLLPFLPFILFGEIKTNAALTLLATALVLRAIRKGDEAPRPWRHCAIAGLFGLGTMTKAFVLPLMAAYYVHETDFRDARSLVRSGVDVLIAVGTAVLVMAPFGVAAVMRNTLLFNAVLEDRAALTTFYPNVLSGPLAWLGLSKLYPPAAAASVAAVILATRKRDLHTALLAAAAAFLLASPTPEPQFLPALLVLVVIAQGTALERAGAASGTARRSTGFAAWARRARRLFMKSAITGGLVLLVHSTLAVAAPAAGSPAAEGARRVHFDLAARSAAPETGRPSFSLAGCRPPNEPAAPDDEGTAPKPERLPSGNKRRRAWIELGAFTAAATVNYWLGNSFPEDRDYRIDFDSQFSRVLLLEGWRFDSNQFSLNWSHALAGAVYYQFGRSNRQSWLYSWFMAAAASTWWEIVGEPKEVIAVNDQIMTGLGGLALGEPWHQIGHFLAHQPSPVLRALGFLNPAVKLNHWLDRRDPAADDHVPPGWREFRLFAGVRRLSSAGAGPATDVYLGVRAELLGPPEYGAPGLVRRAVKDAWSSEIAFDYALRGGHAEETRFATRAVVWGRFVQKIDRRGDGSSLFIGLGSAFELFKKRPLAPYDAVPVPVKSDPGPLRIGEPRNFTDKLALLHVAGPVLDWTLLGRGLRVRTVVEAYADFALVNSQALNGYSRSHDISGLKTTLFYYGYYYGLGATLAARVRLDWKGFRVHGLASLGSWGSIDFGDRFPADVTNNAHLDDSRIRALAGIGWTAPGTPLELFFDLESVRRRGTLAGTRAASLETKAYAGVAFVF
ncbi:MAG TPA: DUF3943 domain-containing protein [Candidatus Aminicenantes bacterium]|nr:DUF3943 domain-containing protein [Candidatus Aminicenantes bacterium]